MYTEEELHEIAKKCRMSLWTSRGIQKDAEELCQDLRKFVKSRQPEVAQQEEYFTLGYCGSLSDFEFKFENLEIYGLNALNKAIWTSRFVEKVFNLEFSGHESQLLRPTVKYLKARGYGDFCILAALFLDIGLLPKSGAGSQKESRIDLYGYQQLIISFGGVMNLSGCLKSNKLLMFLALAVKHHLRMHEVFDAATSGEGLSPEAFGREILEDIGRLDNSFYIETFQMLSGQEIRAYVKILYLLSIADMRGRDFIEVPKSSKFKFLRRETPKVNTYSWQKRHWDPDVILRVYAEIEKGVVANSGRSVFLERLSTDTPSYEIVTVRKGTSFFRASDEYRPRYKKQLIQFGGVNFAESLGKPFIYRYITTQTLSFLLLDSIETFRALISSTLRSFAKRKELTVSALRFVFGQSVLPFQQKLVSEEVGASGFTGDKLNPQGVETLNILLAELLVCGKGREFLTDVTGFKLRGLVSCELTTFNKAFVVCDTAKTMKEVSLFKFFDGKDFIPRDRELPDDMKKVVAWIMDFRKRKMLGNSFPYLTDVQLVEVEDIIYELRTLQPGNLNSLGLAAYLYAATEKEFGHVGSRAMKRFLRREFDMPRIVRVCKPEACKLDEIEKIEDSIETFLSSKREIAELLQISVIAKRIVFGFLDQVSPV